MTTLSLEEGYAVLAQNEQDWISQGRVPSGWKVGLTSVDAQQRVGSDGPCFGRLFADMAVPNESMIEWGRFGSPRIEAEIAFRLGKDLNGEGATVDAIEHTVPSIEIVDSRYPQGPAGPGELVADNVSGAGFVLGHPEPFTSSFDFTGCYAEVERNGKPEAKGFGSACLGSPLLSLEWLADELSRRGRSLRAGDLVLAGSLTIPLAARPGDEIRVEFKGLGSVAVSFEEAA